MRSIRLMVATLAGFCALGQAYQVALTAPPGQEAMLRFGLTCVAAGVSLALFRSTLSAQRESPRQPLEREHASD